MSINPPHAAALARLTRRFGRMLDEIWVIREQSPVTIPPGNSEPEPDLVVARGPDERSTTTRHPNPRDIALVVEVADSTLPVDRDQKLNAYAAADIPEYWIVNLVDRRVEVYTMPRGGK